MEKGGGGRVGPKKDDSKMRVGLLQHYISSAGYRLWRKGGGKTSLKSFLSILHTTGFCKVSIKMLYPRWHWFICLSINCSNDRPFVLFRITVYLYFSASIAKTLCLDTVFN